MLYGITAATAALLLTAALAALLRSFSLRFGAVDGTGPPARRAKPRAPGRGKPVPLLGGVAVAGATALVGWAGDWTGAAPLGPEAGRLLVAGIVVALLGLAADLLPVPPVVVVAGVTGAAALTVPYDELGVPAGALAVAWILFVTQTFRSLDHADGVMGTVGVITAFALSGCAAAEVMDGLAALLSVLAAALTGFLMHGWPPARIAPGRCGSLFAGFVLAAALVQVHAERPVGSGFGAGFALTAVASADAVLVLVSRRRAGRPLLRPAPDHLVHRLRRAGLTRQGVMVVTGLAAFAGALVGLLIDLGWLGAGAAWWPAGAVAVIAVVAAVRPGPRPRRPHPHAIPAPGGPVPRSSGRPERPRSAASDAVKVH
ncbi:MraY family glycosyltransferase [Streptomyces rhizosphaerihabitans]|uniref:MraY family glycosyltransferase n=1 Tax=Streptomyces rhizosphaerihabitans TaxID=1266770 RepID=UPI0021C0F473|nr:undecaprenyl/decaprenyl-phosphate alpha-N-acetylglucosaminyl 1-phosphate transferase [Streptomyces rhizosphaerihabitans]MCT9008347.1 undecaprenyl/decaprenyl-phosphate alpha-N-acetylglucosaminyl 1-phosphate transferase [Streptomyces rhizosphaerihabitans]